MSSSDVFDDAEQAAPLTTNDEQDLPTRRLQRFNIECSYMNLGEIASGNMGAILRARDRDLERDIAIKVMIRPDTKPDQRMRFLAEAQVTGQLEHPNIVPIHSLGTDAHGNPVFAMKLVRGTTLDQVLEDLYRKKRQVLRSWPLPRLISALISICHGIEFAHSKGVIHRDIKPSNIMLGDFGEVLMMDWGLAKIGVHRNVETRSIAAPLHRILDQHRDRAQEPEGRDIRHKLAETRDGAVVGTPKYMAPEQARGEVQQTDARSDVYALGAVLYDILTLTAPVRGRSVSEILYNVRHGNIAPPERRAPPGREVPRELAAIAMKALALHPHHRYQAVADLRLDLENYLSNRPVKAAEDNGWQAMRKLMRRNPVGTALMCTLLLIIATAITVSQVTMHRERQRAEVQARSLQLQLRSLQTLHEAALPAVLSQIDVHLRRGDMEPARSTIHLAEELQLDAPLVRGHACLLAIYERQWPSALEHAEAWLLLAPEEDQAAIGDLIRIIKRLQIDQQYPSRVHVHGILRSVDLDAWQYVDGLF